MKKINLLKKGFTLIELLVVITIIGILATGATATYTSQIQKARDTTRINDIKALESWVNQSYNDTSEYPKWSTLKAELVKYLERLPWDSKNGQPCNDGGTAANAPDCAYAYIAGPDNNGINWGEYELSTAFENLWNVDSKAELDGGWVAWQLTRYEVWIDILGNNTTIAKDTMVASPITWVTINTWASAALAANDLQVVVINKN